MPHDVVRQPPGRTRAPWRHWNGRCAFALLHNLRGSSGPYEVLGEWPLDAAGTGQ
jgi:hypothetical protein